MEKDLFVTCASMPDFDEYVEEIRELWDTHWITNMGKKHNELQELLQNYLQVPHLELLVNGHMALELSLQALKLKKNKVNEVITTPFTFASTTHAIIRNGLVPVFCDISIDDYTIDVTKIERLITENTVAILPVHVYGNICNVSAINDIAKKYNLKVIYDAAHAFGESYKKQPVGMFGDVSCFSFHATKVYNTIEGGAVTFHNPNFGTRLYELKNFGIDGPESICAVGANAKMNEFCAAMGICNLRHVDNDIKKRKILYEYYLSQISEINGIRVNEINAEIEYNYSYFPVLINEEECGYTRNELYDFLCLKHIFPRKYFFPLTNDCEAIKGKYDVGNTPIASYVSERVLTLPLYPEMELSEVKRICESIREYSKKQ